MIHSVILYRSVGKTSGHVNENLVNAKKIKNLYYFRVNCALDIFLRYSPCNEYLFILGYTNE